MRNTALQEVEGPEEDLTSRMKMFSELDDVENAYVYWRSLGFTPFQSAKRAGYANPGRDGRRAEARVWSLTTSTARPGRHGHKGV